MPQSDEAQATGAVPHPPRRFNDARTMRALAHPSRMALWELLTVHGPMTATQVAQYVDDSPSNCSFHLRQLAKYGFVEEADDVVIAGRSRPWRVTHIGFTTTHEPGEVDASFELAAETLGDVTLNRTVERERYWQRHKRAAPEPWRQIGGASTTVWWVTADEASALEAEIEALTYRYRERLADPGSRPKGARPIEFVSLMHPFDVPVELDPEAFGHLSTDDPDSAGGDS